MYKYNLCINALLKGNRLSIILGTFKTQWGEVEKISSNLVHHLANKTDLLRTHYYKCTCTS